MRSDRDREAEEAGERRLRRAAAGEPEHELVQVGLGVLLARAVVDAQGPALRVREHPVHPGQDQVGRASPTTRGSCLTSLSLAQPDQPSLTTVLPSATFPATKPPRL